MATKIDLFDLEARAEALAVTMIGQAEKVRKDERYTADGKREVWQKDAAKFAADVEECRGALSIAREGAGRIYEYALNEAIGEAPSPAEPDTAIELAMARLMGRHEKWGVQEIEATLIPITGTPLAAALVDELVARGEIDETVYRALLTGATPKISEAEHIQPRLQALIEYALAPLVDEVGYLYENGPLAQVTAVTGRLDNSVIKRADRLSLSELVGEGTLVVHETGALDWSLPRITEQLPSLGPGAWSILDRETDSIVITTDDSAVPRPRPAE